MAVAAGPAPVIRPTIVVEPPLSMIYYRDEKVMEGKACSEQGTCWSALTNNVKWAGVDNIYPVHSIEVIILSYSFFSVTENKQTTAVIAHNNSL